MSVCLHADIALLSLTRNSLWKRLNLVPSYCHEDFPGVDYTKKKEPILAGILQHLKESHEFSLIQQVSLDSYFMGSFAANSFCRPIKM